MLKRHHRLSERKTIAYIYRRGPIKRSQSLNLRYLPNQLERPRLVVVVATKVSKKATLRNRLRRRLSSLIRQNFIEQLGAYDMVINVQADVSSESTEDLIKQLQNLFSQADLLA